MRSPEIDLDVTRNEKRDATAEKYGLDAMFSPRSVVVIGATDRPGTVGRTVLENLLHAFQGPVYPVNSKHDKVLGLKAYKRVGDIPQSVDLAVIATPAATVPQLVGECVAAVKYDEGQRDAEGAAQPEALGGHARRCAHRPALRGKPALEIEQCRPHTGNRGDRG